MLKAMMLVVCIVFSGVAVATVNYAGNTVGANRVPLTIACAAQRHLH